MSLLCLICHTIAWSWPSPDHCLCPTITICHLSAWCCMPNFRYFSSFPSPDRRLCPSISAAHPPVLPPFLPSYSSTFLFLLPLHPPSSWFLLPVLTLLSVSMLVSQYVLVFSVAVRQHGPDPYLSDHGLTWVRYLKLQSLVWLKSWRAVTIVSKDEIWCIYLAIFSMVLIGFITLGWNVLGDLCTWSL